MVWENVWNIFRSCFINNFILKNNFWNIKSPKFKTSSDRLRSISVYQSWFSLLGGWMKSPATTQKFAYSIPPTRKILPTKVLQFPSKKGLFSPLNKSPVLGRALEPNVITRFPVIFGSNMRKQKWLTSGEWHSIMAQSWLWGSQIAI